MLNLEATSEKMFDNSDYRAYCKECINLPVFFKDWWLDAVCGENNWCGLVLKSGNTVKAIWPLSIERYSFKRKYYSQPKFTPFLGVYFIYPEGMKYCSRLSFEKETIEELLALLGEFDSFSQTFSSRFTNWLPFFWKGFTQTTTYTYRISPLADNNNITSNFKENIRREIRKAIKQGIKIEEIQDIHLFYSVVKKTYKRQNVEINFPLSLIKIIDNACIENNCRKILAAKDSDGKIHCVIYLVWDSDTMYYLIGGGDPKLRSSGATSLLLFESIKFAATKVDCFDFEGSVIEPIERFFRAFGAIQTPLFVISKTRKKEIFLQKLISYKNKVWK